MHEAALSYAALPAPAVVLGMVLREYSLGHELYLERERNPLKTRSDIAQAVLICCQSWDEAKAMRHDWLIGIKLRFWRWRTRNLKTDIERSEFLTYRAQGSLEFALSDAPRPGDNSTPRRMGCPFLLRLHQWLMTSLRLSESQAWDYPYGLGKMRWACHYEQEGGLDIYNDHDEEFDRFVAEQEAKGKEMLCRQ